MQGSVDVERFDAGFYRAACALIYAAAPTHEPPIFFPEHVAAALKSRGPPFIARSLRAGAERAAIIWSAH